MKKIPRERTASTLIVGGGIGALTLAYRMLLARSSNVVVLESRGNVGGLVAQSTMDSLTFDIGAESWARRSNTVKDLAEELGLAEILPAGRSWVYTETGPHLIPQNALLGIPSDPMADDVRERLSPAGLAAALEDQNLGPEVGADATSLAELVEARMGTEVLRELVAPIAGGIHSADPRQLDPNTVTPGLIKAMTETGSLAAGVQRILAARPEGGPVGSVEGGMGALIGALRTKIEELGGRVLTRHPVTSISELSEAGPYRWQVEVADAEPFFTQNLVLGADDATNLDLLAELEPHDITLPEAASIIHWTMVVESSDLDSAPRGSGLLVQAGTPGMRAKAVTHLSQKWEWLGKLAGPGRHVLRVSYGRPGEDCSDVTLADALADASTLMGVELTEENVKDSRLINWGKSLTPRSVAFRAQIKELGSRLGNHPGLYGVGAWVAGSGLSAVIDHAQELAEELGVGSASIGTRGSQLALTQSTMVARNLVDASEFSHFHIHEVVTEGDVNTAPLKEIGGTGVFVTALRDDLKAGRCDFAVHSAKDLPSKDEPGLEIVAPARVDPSDALCAGSYTLDTLPQGATVGTGSPRRVAQLRAVRPDLQFVPIRGNVPTRLAKVGNEVDAVVLALAGLERLGLTDEVSEVLSPDVMLPAACQGILAIEIPSEPADERARKIRAGVEAIRDPNAQAAAVAERAFMSELGAGCTTPVGVLATLDGTEMTVRARVISDDGQIVLEDSSTAPIDLDDDETSREVGTALARRLVEAGARHVGGIE